MSIPMLLPMPRFSNGLLTIYWIPLTLSKYQMAASKPSKIRPSLSSLSSLPFTENWKNCHNNLEKCFDCVHW